MINDLCVFAIVSGEVPNKTFIGKNDEINEG